MKCTLNIAYIISRILLCVYNKYIIFNMSYTLIVYEYLAWVISEVTNTNIVLIPS